MKPLFRLAAGALGLAAPLVFATTRIGPTLDESHRRVRQVTRFGQEDYKAALARYRGATYVAAIESVKGTIPETEPYLMVDGAVDGPDTYFVRFDLAPRPSVWLGPINETPVIALAKLRNLEPDVKWVVIARLPDPGPEALSREEYIRQVESQQ